MSPPEYTPEVMTDQIRAWIVAAKILRPPITDKQREQALTMLIPDNDDPYSMMALLHTQITLGALMCAQAMVEATGGEFGQPPPDGGEWVAEQVYPDSEPSAVQRVAAQAIVAAANGDAPAAIAIAAAWMMPPERLPGGAQAVLDRMAALLIELLVAYQSVAGAELTL